MKHLQIIYSLLSLSLNIRSYSTGFNCPAFWESYDEEFCYMVLNSKWPVSHEDALNFCRAFSDSTKDGTLLEILPGMDIHRLNIATPNTNYWIGPVKFLDNFYNLIHDTGKVEMDVGDGGCSILSMSMNDSNLIPTVCGIGERPFVCGLYPKKLERKVSKRSRLNCEALENTVTSCSEWSSEICEESTKGCEKHCCEVVNGIKSSRSCAGIDDDAWNAKTCSFIKASGSCQKHFEKCSFTCCEEIDKTQLKLEKEPCSTLSDTKPARYCYDKAFALQSCDEESFRDNECAFACCVENQSGISDIGRRRRRFITSLSSSSPFSSSTETPFSGTSSDFIFSTTSATSSNSPSTTSTETYWFVECYDSGLENKKGDDFCLSQLLNNPSKCEQENFVKKCELSCCLIDPSSCYQYDDVLSEQVCYTRVLLGRCSEAATAEKCKRSCCDAGELVSSTTTGSATTTETEEETTTATSTTPGSTTFELCGEYTDIGENCERRVDKGRCTDPLNEEVKCQYSCCLDLFKTTTFQTTEETTTESPSDEGIIECINYADISSPEFCAAVMSENECSVYESQHLCEFSCCMYNFAHDTEDPEIPEVDINEDCDNEVDTLELADCLEAFVLGNCDETPECAKTCCLWSGAFYGNPCLMFIDESGYEYCTINCFDQCDDDNLCEVLCQRTVCLFCNKPSFWPSSTTEPSECYGLTNEDSGVDCALKAAQGDCSPVDQYYDEQCNFACCVVDVHQKRSARNVLTMEIVPANPVTKEAGKTSCLDDPDCISDSSVNDLLVRKKRSELDREMQIQPSYVFIGSVLTVAKLCL